MKIIVKSLIQCGTEWPATYTTQDSVIELEDNEWLRIDESTIIRPMDESIVKQ